MWNRKKILFLCVLLFFILSSPGFSQSGQKVPITGFLSADSTGVRAGQIPAPMSPARNGLPVIAIEIITSGKDTLQGPFLSPDPKCQWVRFEFSTTNWKWYLRKPGTYAGEILVGSIWSNGEVCVDFDRFSNLHCTDGSGERLKTYYAISTLTSNIEEVTWMNPNQLNDYNLHFDEHPIVPATWALWQKIEMGNSARAAEFEDRAVICINLLNLKTWIDPVVSGL